MYILKFTTFLTLLKKKGKMLVIHLSTVKTCVLHTKFDDNWNAQRKFQTMRAAVLSFIKKFSIYLKILQNRNLMYSILVLLFLFLTSSLNLISSFYYTFNWVSLFPRYLVNLFHRKNCTLSGTFYSGDLLFYYLYRLITNKTLKNHLS